MLVRNVSVIVQLELSCNMNMMINVLIS